MNIRQARKTDIHQIAHIYSVCFPNERSHLEWITACFQSAPKGIYYVVEADSEIVGYILWCVKNGFREKTIVELEQVGVHPDFSGKGYGKHLVIDTFNLFKNHT